MPAPLRKKSIPTGIPDIGAPVRINLLSADERKLALAWGALAAAAIWLGFPNDVGSLPPAVLLWPLALINLAFLAHSSRQAFLWSWLATAVGAVAALYWLALPVAQVGGLPWPAAFACAVLIACILALQGGFFGMLAAFARRRPFWQGLVLMVLGWYLLETAFAIVAGFPWLPLAGALAVWPVFVQTADIFGAWMTGAIWLGVLLVCCARGRRFLGAGLLLALLAYGQMRLYLEPLDVWPQGPQSQAVLMVEGNVEQNQKWLPIFQKKTLELYLDLTQQGLEENAARFAGEKPFVIWPETALPFFFETNAELAQKLNAAVSRWGCPLLFGAPGIGRAPGGEEIYNRAFLLSPDGEPLGHYDKRHLVPFGEYVPAWLKLDFLDKLLQGVGVYAEGNSARPLLYGQLALGILICYEGIFPWLAQTEVKAGSNLLVDISNDGWFGKTPAARQHLYLTALRGVEQGRWLLRATNTGISAVIDARGRIVARGPMFEAGNMACRARLAGGFTIYHYLADWLPWLALGVFSGLLTAGWRGGACNATFE